MTGAFYPMRRNPHSLGKKSCQVYRDDSGNGTLARTRKKSFNGYRDVINSNGANLKR
jgi:beta-glucosidase/6-phospho-beta-glucosidase/beta-galactosidase